VFVSFLRFFLMVSSISLSWSACHVVAGHGGWTRLVGVPQGSLGCAALRLQALGASSVTILPSGAIRFRAGASICQHLVAVFPTCPLPA
jgi:hypothetical protein